MKVTCALWTGLDSLRPVLMAEPWANKDGSSGRLSDLPEVTQRGTPGFCGAVAQEVRGGEVFI